MILNQQGQSVMRVYLSIGQKDVVAQVVTSLQEVLVVEYK